MVSRGAAWGLQQKLEPSSSPFPHTDLVIALEAAVHLLLILHPALRGQGLSGLKRRVGRVALVRLRIPEGGALDTGLAFAHVESAVAAKRDPDTRR
eukprot:CAMPEP_0180665980 /NCGR_PEP_ID=MMETSP1037_2-20121125/61572_1 /TAXON_ID=632150 /ORGANISM="Azadinium spinosum, Strain 3D9" /LENGTH=95 /DNA_ID=CAMNT_0022694461 /DNA_START=77 /DNA_END=362 /DNA_ORIENTATION=-